MSGQFLLLSCFEEISELNANSVDPDQMPHSVASDLGLYCLPMTLLWDARHKWVNIQSIDLLTQLKKILICFSFHNICFSFLVLSDVMSVG